MNELIMLLFKNPIITMSAKNLAKYDCIFPFRHVCIENSDLMYSICSCTFTL